MHRPIAIVALTMGLSCAGGGERMPAPARNELARITGRQGAVDVLRAGLVDWERIADNANLYEDDRLRTFKGAWAHLVFIGGSSLRVDEESLISLGGGIMIERGSVEGELQAGLRLRTPTAEAESVAARDIVIR
jgi:hypothetical protein